MEALTEIESQVIDIEEEEEEKESSYLVGRLVAEENWNPSDLIQAMKSAWEPKHGMSWRGSKLIFFSFDDVMDRDWVLQHQPWHFHGYLFAIKKCRGDEHVVAIEHASYWVRLYDVPISCMTEMSLGLLSKQIGVLESVDKSDEDSVGTFVRFKVSINITKRLMRGVSVRVKGKPLWLPLKYESLPIYCFCCGTIGHRHKNCPGYNQNLKYSTCRLRATEEQKGTPTSLPHNIIENILSHLPAKYLLRFKVVSKQWKATISDPRFAEIHPQQCMNSSSRDLLAWEPYHDYKGLLVSEIQSDKFQLVPHSRKYSSVGDHICDCDGLYMRYFDTTPGEGKTYLLWNPSCRAYKEIRCPQPIDDSDAQKTYYGIYYNQRMKDYNVVIVGTKHYAVFSCRYNKWGEVKEIKNISCSSTASWNKGVSLNGCFYWLTELKGVGEDVYDFEIICFDGEVEKFQKVPMPDYCKERTGGLVLTSSRSKLSLFLSHYDGGIIHKVSIWSKVEKDSWREFAFLWNLGRTSLFRPICWLNEDEVMLLTHITYKHCHILYNKRKNSYKLWDCPYPGPRHPVIYRENIFFS